MQQIADTQKTLLDNVGELLNKQREASTALKQLVDDQKNWGQSLEKALQEFTTTARVLNQLPSAINQWAVQLEELVKELRIEHQAQINVTQQTSEVAAKLQMALEQVQDAANSLRSLSKDYFEVMNMMQAFPATVNGNLSQVSQAIVTVNGNLSQLSQAISNAASRLNGSTGR